MKIITTGQIFLSNYQGFLNKQVNLYELSFLCMWVQTKIWNTEKIKIRVF
jgi:hypothetical protein